MAPLPSFHCINQSTVLRLIATPPMPRSVTPPQRFPLLLPPVASSTSVRVASIAGRVRLLSSSLASLLSVHGVLLVVRDSLGLLLLLQGRGTLLVVLTLRSSSALLGWLLLGLLRSSSAIGTCLLRSSGSWTLGGVVPVPSVLQTRRSTRGLGTCIASRRMTLLRSSLNTHTGLWACGHTALLSSRELRWRVATASAAASATKETSVNLRVVAVTSLLLVGSSLLTKGVLQACTIRTKASCTSSTLAVACRRAIGAAHILATVACVWRSDTGWGGRLLLLLLRLTSVQRVLTVATWLTIMLILAWHVVVVVWVVVVAVRHRSGSGAWVRMLLLLLLLLVGWLMLLRLLALALVLRSGSSLLSLRFVTPSSTESSACLLVVVAAVEGSEAVRVQTTVHGVVLQTLVALSWGLVLLRSRRSLALLCSVAACKGASAAVQRLRVLLLLRLLLLLLRLLLAVTSVALRECIRAVAAVSLRLLLLLLCLLRLLLLVGRLLLLGNWCRRRLLSLLCSFSISVVLWLGSWLGLLVCCGLSGSSNRLWLCGGNRWLRHIVVITSQEVEVAKLGAKAVQGTLAGHDDSLILL